MEIYLLRHGIAEDRRNSGTDAERPLTAEGKEKLRRVLDRARSAGVEPSLMLSSPLVRAVQTAELAAEVLGYKGKIVRTDALLSEATPEALWAEVRSRRGEEAVLLAGHEPHLSTSVAYLLGTPTLTVEMKKGALVRIDVERLSGEPRGMLKWMLTAALAG
jgi:phosphohistidine phosphatase